MKFKKLAKSAAAIALGATLSFTAFAFVGCKDEDDPSKDPIIVDNPADAEISVNVDKNVLTAGSSDTVKATVTIENFSNKSVEWTLSGTGVNYVEFNKETGVLSLKSGLFPQTEVQVTLTATSTVSNTIKASATVTIKPLVQSGVVGELTTEMFTALGNPSITVTGEVTDIYDDLTPTNADVQDVYDYKVMMSDGAWYGEWNKKGMTAKDINNYRRSAETDKSGNHTFDQVFINKNNEKQQKAVTDYNSIPAYWEEQHLWNHLYQIGTNVENQWKHDTVNDVYVYQFDNKSVEDLYLRTYLAFSLTPMLGNSDTLENIFLTVEDGKITKMKATTSVSYFGGKEEGSSENATAMSYTTLVATFSDVGTTVVPDPTPFEADYKADVLAQAIKNMGDAKKYTFQAKDTTISAPSAGDGDYSEMSLTTYKTSASNTSTATGTIGILGKVTPDAILLAKTSKYEAGLENENLYRTEYSGYKQNKDGTYDYFTYNADLGALAGERLYKGNIFDKMPKFDFSENLFEYAGTTDIKGADGKWKGYPTFVLREPAITRDIAMEVSAHGNATDAFGATFASFKITVNPDTNRIHSVSYPYSLIKGTYLGIIETTFSDIGTTDLPEDTFDGYVKRVPPTSWSQLSVKYYHATHDTRLPYDEIDAGTLLTNVFGADASKMPSPEVFYKAFEDTLAGPFFDWETEDNTSTGGTVKYYDYMSVNVQIDECDENGKITTEQHDAAIAVLTEELAKLGFVKSTADSQTTYYGTTYSVYTNGKIMIKVENMRTRYFYIDFLPSEIWWHYDPDLSKAPTEKK